VDTREEAEAAMRVRATAQEIGVSPCATRHARSARRWQALACAAGALVLLTMLVSACAPSPQEQAAQQSKARLDAELRHARIDLGIPDSLLQPIITQEQKVAAGANNASYKPQDAAANYQLLYSQLVGVEQTALQTLQTQTQSDLQAFTTALNTRRAQGFILANTYQTRLGQALGDYGAAHTPGDYARLDAFVRRQTEALNTLWPAYQKLQDFKDTLRAVRLAGVNPVLGDLEYTQDVQALLDASSAGRYQRLVGVIDGQTMQLMADQTEALPYIGSTMLAIFQARIAQLEGWGETAAATKFQAEHDADAQDLAAASTLADYLTLGQLVTKQTDEMVLPWSRGQARDDLRQLRQQVNAIMAQYPLLAYEYANQYEGIGSLAAEFAAAAAVDGYLNADSDIRVLLTNLRALQDNLRDTTPAWQAHRVDLQLMQTYGIITGKVIVVSLTEQTARFYENGALVYWSYVTTGRPELPSPPGLHYAMEKDYHIEFKSSDPKTSPLWYGPTAINYAILYANYGYFLHDAWWRYKFGPGSNLPHWDPLAFNGGSHGCINLPEANMAWVFKWTPVGAPILVY
jgi:L,D-transpeptidase catalytic domain